MLKYENFYLHNKTEQFFTLKRGYVNNSGMHTVLDRKRDNFSIYVHFLTFNNVFLFSLRVNNFFVRLFFFKKR